MKSGSNRYLLDTNILLRWADPRQPTYLRIREAVDDLLTAGHSLCITPQVIVEFWNVWTRPLGRNGFGYTPAEAATAVETLRDHFWLAEDRPAIFHEWLTLVRDAGVSGVQVHDARLVAVMRTHGLTHLLTLNPRDFTRYAGIQIIEPSQLAGSGT